ncbi:MAG TPA: tetratricopeptide repeat protein, partial [Chloroflexia bacterium]|nr:tetratricopeptide repeat protein [Chloroflexia bacterium]
LAVFVGGCTVAAAAAVGRDEGSGVRGQGSENDPENDPRITDPAVPNPKSKIQNPKSDAILDGLVELADQSLLRQVAGADGEPRFIMLETVREYAWERLEAQGEAAALQCRHAEFFVAWAQPPPPGAPAPPLGVIIARREEEHDNLRAVLQWTLDHGEAEMALRLAGALWGFWDRQGYLSEGRRWLDAALAQRAQAPVRARLAALYGAGILACSQGEPAAGEVWLAERLALGRELHDPPVMAWSLYGIAWAATGQGDFARVVRLGTECLALFREQANKEGVSLTLRRLATAAQVQGDLAQARAYTEESLARDRERDDAVGVAANLSALGELARLHGDYTHAAAYYEESLALNRVGGVKTRLIPVLHNLGHVALHEQNTARAAILFAEGLGLSRELGHKPLIAACLAGLAGVAAGDHQPERAARLFGAVDHLHQQIGGRLESIDQAEYDRNLATARAGLDAAAWDQAWRAGALLTLEQAIAYAVPVES